MFCLICRCSYHDAIFHLSHGTLAYNYHVEPQGSTRLNETNLKDLISITLHHQFVLCIIYVYTL